MQLSYYTRARIRIAAIRAGLKVPALGPKGIDETQLKTGIEVEKEHTRSKTIAMIIALHHLEEIPNYYSRLLKMEKKAMEGLNHMVKTLPPGVDVLY